MAKRLPFVAAFLAILVAGDRLGAFALGAILDNSNIPLARMYAGRAESDVLLLGNSRAYRHFDIDALSKEFGRPVANLSTPGASTLVSLVLLGDFIDIYGPPTVVVMELSGLTMNQDAAIDLRPFGPRTERMGTLLRDTHPRLYYAAKVSRLFSFNNTFFLNAAHKVFFPLPNLLLRGALTEPISAETVASWQGSYFTTRPENAAALKALIDMTERHGIELQLVISPALPAYVRQNGYLAWRDEISTTIGDTRIWDYGIQPQMAPEFFFDPVHLNVRGVDTFMGLLRRDGFFNMTE